MLATLLAQQTRDARSQSDALREFRRAIEELDTLSSEYNDCLGVDLVESQSALGRVGQIFEVGSRE